MKKLFTLVLGLSIGLFSYGQVIFESDLSSWDAGDPTGGWMGAKTNLASENIIEQTFGVEHGTAMAQLINNDDSHKRFTTTELTVTELETYEIKMWVTGYPGSELRTGYYDVDNDGWYYNDYLDLDAETGGDLTMLTQTITVPSGCTSAEVIFSIRNTDALVGIVLDSVSVSVTEGEEPELVSIYDIQYATEAPYISAYEGSLVTTSGIVTGVFMAGANEGKFFIQDGEGAWNGIYVYESGTAVNIGDSVVVTGKVDEFFELTEIVDVLLVDVISSDNALPAPVELSTADVVMEEYEGVLVKVTDAACTNDDAGFGQFEVNDGSGARLIDDEMFSYTATLGNYYNITGVSFLSFGEVKVYPRSIDDIEVAGYAGISNNENTLTLYPNPAQNIVNLTIEADATVVIYSATGAAVYQESGNVNTIDVSNFDTGLYMVVVTTASSTSSAQLMVK